MRKIALRGHVSSVESARSEGDDWFGSGRSTENRSSVSGSHSIVFHVADMLGAVGRSLDPGEVKIEHDLIHCPLGSLHRSHSPANANNSPSLTSKQYGCFFCPFAPTRKIRPPG
jgi:hypothetical protein